MLRFFCLSLFVTLFAISLGWSDEAVSNKESDLDSMNKEEILASVRWKRAELALDHWLSVQNIYTPEELADLEIRCDAEIQAMNTEQLRTFLRDTEAKLDILLSPEVQQARDWVGSYLAVLALPKQEELRKSLPDVANMTPQQVEEAARSFLKMQQKYIQKGATETARRKDVVARGREENARHADAKNRQLQQRQQAKADRANARAGQASKNSMENARQRAADTPDWYQRRRGWFGGWGWRQ